MNLGNSFITGKSLQIFGDEILPLMSQLEDLELCLSNTRIFDKVDSDLKYYIIVDLKDPTWEYLSILK